MPRHDAFGNEVTTSTGSGGLPGMPEDDGRPSRRPPTERPPAQRSPKQPLREPRRTPRALIVGLTVTVVMGSFVLSLLSSPNEKAPQGPTSSPALTRPAPTDGADTLFTLDVLADRLTDLEDAGYEDVGSALIRPGLMTITARREGGRTSLVQVRPTGEPKRISTVPTSRLLAFAPISDIEPTVPEKLVKRVLDDGRTVQDIDALAIAVNDDGIVWQTQMKDKSTYLADADGQVTNKLP